MNDQMNKFLTEDYDLVSSIDERDFVSLVNKKIADGWDMRGPTFTKGNWFYQAFTREKIKPRDWKRFGEK